MSKKIGNSVVRNKVRRRMREALRLYADELHGGRLLVFIARSGIEAAGFRRIRDDMEYLLKKQGVLQK